MPTSAPSMGVGREAYPTDPDFPQLETATDPSRMLELFRAHLRPAGDRALRIAGCALFRFRCRQSSPRCLLQYTLRVEDPRTGRQWDTWVTGILYADSDKTARRTRSLRATDPLLEIPERWRTFEPVSSIPELEMFLEVFPYDRRLPQLCRVLDWASRDLEPLLRVRRDPGGEQAVPTIETLRYRSEFGAVFRCEFPAAEHASGCHGIQRCYLKVYADDLGSETHEFLQVCADREARGPRPYSVVRPLGYERELRTLIQEEAPGTSLQDILIQDRDPVAAVRAVARAVAAFHQDDVGVTRTHTLSDQLDQVKRASALVQWACPELREHAARITDALVAGLVEVAPAQFHRDLKLDHVFLSGGQVVFVDMDSVALGDPVRDVAHFCAHLIGCVERDVIPREMPLGLATVFAAEYFSRVPRAWRQQFLLHLAGSLLEVSCGIFRHQGPRWRERATAVIKAASRTVSAASR